MMEKNHKENNINTQQYLKDSNNSGNSTIKRNEEIFDKSEQILKKKSKKRVYKIKSTQLLDDIFENEVVQTNEAMIPTPKKKVITPKTDKRKKKIYKLILKDRKDDESDFYKDPHRNINFDSVDSEEKEEEDEQEESYSLNKALKIFNQVTSHNINEEIYLEDLYYFFMNELPNENTFITNIHTKKEINNKKENKENELLLNKFFDYSLEINKNNKFYFFAKIKKSYPYIKVNIFISKNYFFLLNDLYYNDGKYFNNNNFEKNLSSTFIKVGKIESNYLRNYFFVYKGDNKTNYKLIMKINYSINFFGIFGARKMFIERYNNKKKIDLILENDLPKWDSEYNKYKLCFNGRVKIPSKKNFILKIIEDKRDNFDENISGQKDIKDKNVIQCGKIEENMYSLDFIYLSPFECFSIAISSIVNKVSCE